ncbi:MAG: hypothetical protein FD161_77 [Limisphaerales bacterium]|nr:MAG: hypothetical protein FD161_77 [Limisphaerales bacterium]KAG0510523.1 MAG: hypothetical protein E1N63_77 [Limisphaerales bacterium]TXT52796.1 MAG: hypothetical protein FD140_339 [Limisphaerales bacterium]
MKLLWVGDYPAMRELHRLGLEKASRRKILKRAQAMVPDPCTTLDMTNALELAAEKYLEEHGHAKPHA